MSGSDRPRSSYSVHVLPSTAPDRARRREQVAKLLLGIAANGASATQASDADAPANGAAAPPPRAA